MAPLRQLDNGDGWTEIRRRDRGRNPTHDIKPPAPDREVTVDDVRRDYDAKTKVWRASSCHRLTFQLLDRIRSEGGRPITTAVCLATGSFSRDNLSNRRRSMFQFVAFMQIIAHLQTSMSSEIEVFAQDPLYTESDRGFLSTLNIHLSDPSEIQQPRLGTLKDYIGPGSLVFEPFMGLKLDDIDFLVYSGLELYIGTSLADYNRSFRRPETSKYSSEHVARISKLKQDCADLYEHKQMSHFHDDPLTFEGIHIHWKKEIDIDSCTEIVRDTG